jgi:uncharacterized membrane protein YfhO
MEVLNMLNTKYFIVANQQQEPVAQMNPGACGNAWFVPEFKWVANADSEMSTLDKIQAKKFAVIDKRFTSLMNGFTSNFDSTASIKLTSYQANELKYESNSKAEQLAIFSEIYYPNGWNAYVDGKLTPHFGCNYVLRAMRVPAGKHSIEFKFEPAIYSTGENISLASSILLYLLVAGAIYAEYRNRKNKESVTLK